MRIIFLIGLILTVAFLSVAQNDNKARQILNEVSEKSRSHNTISAEFIFTMENQEMDIDEKNEGSIKLKGQKYVVELPDIGVQVFSDGKTIWNYMADGNQVTISNMEDENSELMDPSSIFTIYEKGFRSEFIGEKNKNNKTVYEIELFPDADEYEVTKISLLIDKNQMMISSATLHGNDGNLYGIEVVRMETDDDVSDSYFVFNPDQFNDIEIIDFR